MTLSVVIITKNEAAVIARCLASVAWADEIVMLDSGSTDGTAAIARGLNARVESTTDWPGYGAQKNRALALATGDWVLSLDADEWVTPELRAAMTRSRPGFVPTSWRRACRPCGRWATWRRTCCRTACCC